MRKIIFWNNIKNSENIKLTVRENKSSKLKNIFIVRTLIGNLRVSVFRFGVHSFLR